ncbi:hypothetical protein OCK02_17360 [Rhizobium sp. TRM96647]|uniref:hypothetical protein n=1 Tax=unclassified Rhizobium TaxID=2613769 RepID=UPI0021E884E9|nr:MULTISPECIES: hypothetical protein [unclassified Rhizobium]MCV3737973.1 hypothetical protein [Rhizobium sp. TRM96647]MCV3759660.1 hypothetical protein [Rhizobium sp. TRM96650]
MLQRHLLVARQSQVGKCALDAGERFEQAGIVSDLPNDASATLDQPDDRGVYFVYEL